MVEKKDLLAGSQSCHAKNLHCISACGAFYMRNILHVVRIVSQSQNGFSAWTPFQIKKNMFFYFSVQLAYYILHIFISFKNVPDNVNAIVWNKKTCYAKFCWANDSLYWTSFYVIAKSLNKPTRPRRPTLM